MSDPRPTDPVDPETKERIQKLQALCRDREWRLRNLYWILTKTGEKVRFNPNRTQRRLLARLARRNIVLKSRQHGITTLMCLLALDTCLFRKNTKAGIIAHKNEDAEAHFRDKVLFAYDNLPAWLKAIRPLVRRDMGGELEFNNGSQISVSLSHRGGTLQFLHITEYGPMCAQFPQRAQEVKTGALNTVDTNAIVTIESTAYGQHGEFYSMTQRAMEMDRAVASNTATRSVLDYHFHFFAWWEDDANEIDPEGVPIPTEQAAYFAELERDSGIVLGPRKKAWYVKKAEEQTDKMKREHPSTPDEAFAQSIEGAYYGKLLAKASAEGRICDLPIVPGVAVNTFWDIGMNGTTAIWFHQQIGLWHHFIDYYENNGEQMDHYVRLLRDKDYLYGTHYLPHDGRNKDWTPSGNLTRQATLESLLHQPVLLVPRIERVQDGIDMVKAGFPLVRIDRTRCGEFKPGEGRGGLPSLRNYRHKWNELLSTFHDYPSDDWASHGADALRQWAQGYPMGGINDEETRAAMKRRRKRTSGMSA